MSVVMTMEKTVVLDREAPVKGIVAQVVTMLNGQAQRASLPIRSARLLQRSRTQTPSDAGISDGSASPAPAPSTLLQDVVDIKTLLLQLKRVLQEPGEEHHSMSSETLDPLLAACAESPARGNGRRPPASPLHPDACAEMRRQILYLQSQLEERDRAVRVLQQQMLRMAEAHEPRADDTCNVATQTDRLRPPMGTTLTSSENSGLVSWNEQGSGRKLPLHSEAQKTKRASSSGHAKCECGAGVQLRRNSRVGTQYLRALAGADRSRSTDCVPRAAPPAPPAPAPASPPSTDTDCSSDGGYRSLPSGGCASPARASAIPRRSPELRLDARLAAPRRVRASAV